MNDVGKKMGIGELLKKHPRIRIPMIQRDYAQGRLSPRATEIRGQFLTALQNALNPVGAQCEPLNLDFVYGSVENKELNYFEPLDGQQRLTTLFLLHWYLAWLDDEWAAFSGIFADGDKCRLSYEVRPSSEDFFNKLVRYRPNKRPVEVPSLKATLTDQSWYLRYFDRDPTIKSAVTMLEDIHARFRSYSPERKLFRRLADPENPAITFQALDLEEFGLSDDLYIKMNARGKALTAFETFKAQYEEKLTTLFPTERRSLNGTAISITQFVSRRMDTAWSDFFWKFGDNGAVRQDEALMNFLRGIALITRDLNAKEYYGDVAILTNKVAAPAYSEFDRRGWLDRDFTEMVIALLERWRLDGATLKALLPDKRYFDEAAILDRAFKGIGTLSLPEIAQFSGYAMYIPRHDGSTLDADHFQEWMRVVRNLAVNSTIERSDELRAALRGLRDLLPHCDSILAHLAALSVKDTISGFFSQTVREEVVKAGLIWHHPAWRELINRAEGHPYFVGQIGFLCDFSGVSAEWEATGGFAWTSQRHEELQRSFLDYLIKAEAMFGGAGLKDLGECRWERALLTLGDYLLPMGGHWSFLVGLRSQSHSWKRLLRGAGGNESGSRPLLKNLWDKLTTARPYPEQLDEIIDAATGLPAWREALVRTPETIQYCGERAICWRNETEVYLLLKKRMSASHAELFTYAFYIREIPKLKDGGSLLPLSNEYYWTPSGIDEYPHISLTFKHGDKKHEFRIESRGGKFLIRTSLAQTQADVPLQQALTGAGFAADGIWLQSANAPADLADGIKALATTLTRVTKDS